VALNMKIVAIVKKYLPGNVHADYDDGTFEWFDTTELSIIEPEADAERTLFINHNQPPPPTSPWRNAGAKLRLELDDDDIDSLGSHGKEYFSDGIRILSYLP